MWVLYPAISVSEISAHNSLIYHIFTVRLFYCQFISVRNESRYTAGSIFKIGIVKKMITTKISNGKRNRGSNFLHRDKQFMNGQHS